MNAEYLEGMVNCNSFWTWVKIILSFWPKWSSNTWHAILSWSVVIAKPCTACRASPCSKNNRYENLDITGKSESWPVVLNWSQKTATRATLVAVRQPWRFWKNYSRELMGIGDISTTKQTNKQKLTSNQTACMFRGRLSLKVVRHH